MKLAIGGKKKLIIAAAAVVLLLGAGATTWVLLRKDSESKTNDQASQEDPVMKDVATYNSVQEAFIAENYSEAITLAKAYASSGEDDTLKLSALNMCIQAALKQSDNVSKEDCFVLAKEQIAELPNENDKGPWLQQIEKTYSGVTETGESGGPQ